MPARVIPPTQLTEQTRRVLVPLGRHEGAASQALPGLPAAAGAGTSEERERFLVLALREFEQRWEDRERDHAAALLAAEARGAEAVRQEVAESVERLTGVVDGLELQRDEIFQSTEEVVLRVATTVARRIVGDAVLLDDKLVLETVRRALRHAAGAQRILIRVHPADLRLVEQHAAEWSGLAPRSRSLRLEADAHVGRGGCTVETDTGQVVAELEEQLRTLEAALIERVR